jgi:hypothetical protein
MQRSSTITLVIILLFKWSHSEQTAGEALLLEQLNGPHTMTMASTAPPIRIERENQYLYQ